MDAILKRTGRPNSTGVQNSITIRVYFVRSLSYFVLSEQLSDVVPLSTVSLRGPGLIRELTIKINPTVPDFKKKKKKKSHAISRSHEGRGYK